MWSFWAENVVLEWKKCRLWAKSAQKARRNWTFGGEWWIPVGSGGTYFVFGAQSLEHVIPWAQNVVPLGSKCGPRVEKVSSWAPKVVLESQNQSSGGEWWIPAGRGGTYLVLGTQSLEHVIPWAQNVVPLG